MNFANMSSRGPNELRNKPAGELPADGLLCGPNSQRYSPQRSACDATDQIRFCHKSQDSQVVATDSPAKPSSPRRRGDRVNRRAFITLVGGAAAAWPVAGPLSARAQPAKGPIRIGMLPLGA